MLSCAESAFKWFWASSWRLTSVLKKVSICGRQRLNPIHMPSRALQLSQGGDASPQHVLFNEDELMMLRHLQRKKVRANSTSGRAGPARVEDAGPLARGQGNPLSAASQVPTSPRAIPRHHCPEPSN